MKLDRIVSKSMQDSSTEIARRFPISKGVMLTFEISFVGMAQFGEQIMPAHEEAARSETVDSRESRVERLLPNVLQKCPGPILTRWRNRFFGLISRKSARRCSREKGRIVDRRPHTSVMPGANGRQYKRRPCVRFLKGPARWWNNWIPKCERTTAKPLPAASVAKAECQPSRSAEASNLSQPTFHVGKCKSVV